MLDHIVGAVDTILFSFLAARDLLALGSVSKDTRFAAHDAASWKRLFQRDLLHIPVRPPRTCTLQRRNAFSDLDASLCPQSPSESGSPPRKQLVVSWPGHYRVCSQLRSTLRRDDAALQEEMRRLTLLRRNVGDMKARMEAQAPSTLPSWLRVFSTTSNTADERHLNEMKRGVDACADNIFKRRGQLRKDYEHLVSVLSSTRRTLESSDHHIEKSFSL
ncbi:hypothetical protein LEN26_001526 [Aphanomyces euteiches]|nr:hypothetical protein AeMF1_019114 [Aphanomyces euteiches]KAH9161223.1 hypothetical protein LEN26_001526 [Aphanomyces euteiches]KAH9194837.1 hypothetical protein AeNC1_003201 [Aphanomyces euteiches]